ncbi:MAG: TonB-dependent receptor [candidate division KSB1 bacterium]|nr:TonB-dependent receptor [candidate division KSB1 bacterium]
MNEDRIQLRPRMAKRLLLATLLLCCPAVKASAQQAVVVQLQILDAVNGEPVARAMITARRDSISVRALTNEQGRALLILPAAGRWQVVVRRYGYLAYRAVRIVETAADWRIRLQPSFMTTPDIVVLADGLSPQEEARTSTQALTLLSQKEFRRMVVRDVGDALAFVPGMMVKNYGGLGGLKTLSLRGGLATQTPILINGVRFDNFQTGTTDLSLLSLAHFSEVRVLRGGNAALHGADALTGAVQLTTLSPSARHVFSWRSGLGAFGYWENGIRWQAQPGKWRMLMSLLQVRSRGDYPFRQQEFGQMIARRRDNADFQQLQGLFAAERPWPRGRFQLVLFAQESQRGVPGPVLQGRPLNASARQDDADGLLLVTLHQQLSSRFVLQAWGKLRRSDLRYRDPELRIRPEGIDNRYRNVDGLLGGEWRWISGAGLWRLRLEAGAAVLSGDQLAIPTDRGYRRVPRVRRDFQTGVLMWENTIRSSRMVAVWRLQAGVRYSRYSDVGRAWSPFMGINVRPWRVPVHFRMHLSRNYRVPTFSEQYYLNYGNLRIQPEDGVSVEIGAHAALPWLGRAFVDLSLFAIRLRNQIVAAPRSPVFWSTQNIGRTRNHGLELAAEWRGPGDHLWLKLAYTLQNPRDDTPGSRTRGKLLIYLPQEILSATVAAQVALLPGLNTLLNVSVRRVSYRYHLPENDIESLLPGYTVMDGKWSLVWRTRQLHWDVHLVVENPTNVRYEVIKNYPMPGRFWRAGIGLKWAGRR